MAARVGVCPLYLRVLWGENPVTLQQSNSNSGAPVIPCLHLIRCSSS